MGLSPRGRGNRRGRRGCRKEIGSIPAWAGKPGGDTTTPRWSRVYPRVGGETSTEELSATIEQGLSPRGRGNLSGAPATTVRKRSIPAWAGKPTARRYPARKRKVYPRVGGETADPRRHGGPYEGLSPRGRGNLAPSVAEKSDRRSIPAWAGKPPRRAPFAKPRAVYPRVGGETSASF